MEPADLAEIDDEGIVGVYNLCVQLVHAAMQGRPDGYWTGDKAEALRDHVLTEIERRGIPISDYPFIRAWGAFLHSMQYYIDDEVRRARADGAPQRAIYRSAVSGIWHTIDEVSDPNTVRALGAWLIARGIDPDEVR